MRKRYRVLRLGSAAAVLMGLALCLCVAAAGGLARTAGVSASREKRPIYSVETDLPLVSLGINCAWGNEDVPEILAALKKYGIKATFFVVGDWCDKFPESVKLISDEGHEIGSHSDTHADMTKLDDAGILREIRDSSEKLSLVTGKPVTLFRVPSGAYNSRVIELVENEGMYPIQWDCDSLDYKGLSPWDIRGRIMKKIRNGSIMLFHSGTKNTAAALPLVIEEARANGYDFVPVSKLVYPPPYKVNFEGRQSKAD